jgi:hypothetical protein
MYAPFAGSARCRKATIKAHAVQVVAWAFSGDPKRHRRADNQRRHVCAARLPAQLTRLNCNKSELPLLKP